MKDFELNLKTKIYFGKNKVKGISEEIKKYGKKIMLVYGGGSIKKYGIFDEVDNELSSGEIDYIVFGGISPNPRLKEVREGIKVAKENDIDFILAVGGGSVIDASKAIACGIYAKNDVWDYFTGEKEIEKAIPLGVVLTIAATGSEMNINAVITNQKDKQKLAIHSEKVLPKFAVLDPSYTESVPKYHTAAGIADIMAHIFEQYFSPDREAVVSDRMAESLLRVCIEEGPIAYRNGSNYIARANIMWASTLALNGLLSLGKRTDWASHKLAHELSAHYDLAHGATLSIIFPAWMKYVLDENTEWKFVQFGKNVWDLSGSDKIAEKSIEKLEELFHEIGLPTRMREVGIEDDNLEEMAENIKEVYGEIGALKKLDYEDLLNIYKLAF
jgi:hypothetical protein